MFRETTIPNQLQKNILVFIMLCCCGIICSQSKKDSLLEKGEQFLKQKDYKKAQQLFLKASQKFKKQNNNENLARTYLYLSSVFSYKQQQDSANYYLLECQGISEKLKNKSLQANIYLNIAHLNYLNKDFEKALQLAHLAEQIHIQENDTVGIATAYNNLAVLYRNTNNLKNALAYNQKSLALNKARNDYKCIAKSYNNIGLIYQSMGNNNEAIVYYKKAVEANINGGVKNPNPYRNLGALYLNLGKHDVSNSYYTKALEIEKPQQIGSRLKDIYNAMLHNYIRLKDFKKAIDFQEKRDAIEIQNLQEKNKQQLAALQQQQQLYKKEKELEYAQSVAEKNKIIMLIVVGLLCLTVLFFLQSYRASKLKRKQQQLLLERKVLRAQMNPHFIFNALSAIQNSLLDNNPLKSATFLSRFSKLIRQNFEFVNKETIPLSDDLDALKNYIETQQMRFNHSFDYTIEVDDALDTDLIKIPPMLLQPFVENSIEHGFKNKTAQGQLHLALKKEGTLLQVVIQDNGVGFDTSKLGKGYHSSSVFKKRLELLSNISEKSFQIQSSNKGTTVQFKLEIV